ncbi:diaminopimelate epimerase [Maribacter hydrothermalis]|uniref:Diaminopimelate epimerase n=1 Tax=Maribacter hydrothermalis TaxID=1836467 RepID=A0A1B7Z7V9_9FLAO|nr:diaminopimelate epimerase [Maribacter hydrothermalis]APQ15824.1 diaminopimelate epimerase [Maribacter hydrothermalis]OBR38797.1 diaminopimelate epimerase [Maribacter hydrothermalis]
MEYTFYKYQGTGNDFVMIDNRNNQFPKDNVELIAKLCNRRFGVGADGLILLENDENTDFKMMYFNADGRESSMCGNGGRCIVAFAHFLGVIGKETIFVAVDGVHEAIIENDVISLKMVNVHEVKEKGDALFMNTGSPHHVQLVNELKSFNVVKEGARLRYGVYGEKGSNINFVEKNELGGFNIRTYERGVEDETLSCGTGVTAVALGMYHLGRTNENKVRVRALGGHLEVTFDVNNGVYSNIFLKGEAKQVFKGELSW